MKLIVITALLTVALCTGAIGDDKTPPPAPAAANPPAAAPQSAPPAPVPAPAATAPTAPEKTPPVATPGKAPSLLSTGPLMVPPAAASSVKFGYIDFQKIALESATAQKAKNAITASGEKLKKQLSAKGKKLEALKKTLETQAPQMNQLEREAKGKDFQAKVKEYQDSVMNAEKEMAKQEETTTRKLIEQVAKAVKEYGEQKGYTLILSTKDLLYFDGNYPLEDVTGEIIKKLDKP